MNRRANCANLRLRFEYWPVIWLWPLSLVLMQATLAEIGGFAVTVAVIACHLLQLHLIMFYWLNRPPDWQIAAALVILTLTMAHIYFSLLPEKRAYLRAMIGGQMTREEAAVFHDPQRWSGQRKDDPRENHT